MPEQHRHLANKCENIVNLQGAEAYCVDKGTDYSDASQKKLQGHFTYQTSCARGDTICLRPLQVDNVFVIIRQVAPVPAC